MNIAEPAVKVEEVTGVIEPAEGVTVEQALADANLQGYEKLEVRDGKIYVTWFKRVK